MGGASSCGAFTHYLSIDLRKSMLKLDADMDPADEAIAAASQPTRRRILNLVSEHEVSATDIAAHFDLTRPAVSQHLKVLRNAGLVHVRKEGTERLYQANKEALAEVVNALADFWSLGMLRLKTAVEAKGKKPGRSKRKT